MLPGALYESACVKLVTIQCGRSFALQCTRTRCRAPKRIIKALVSRSPRAQCVVESNSSDDKTCGNRARDLPLYIFSSVLYRSDASIIPNNGLARLGRTFHLGVEIHGMSCLDLSPPLVCISYPLYWNARAITSEPQLLSTWRIHYWSINFNDIKQQKNMAKKRQLAHQLAGNFFNFLLLQSSLRMSVKFNGVRLPLLKFNKVYVTRRWPGARSRIADGSAHFRSTTILPDNSSIRNLYEKNKPTPKSY